MKICAPLLAIALSVSLFSCHQDEGPEDVRAQLLEEVNALRIRGCTCGSDSLKPVHALVWNKILAKVAEDHAIDMYQSGTVSDGSSFYPNSPPGRAKKAGYTGTNVGENNIRGYAFVAEVVQAWHANESDCKKMMDSTYTEMGGAGVRYYWTLDLGAP